MTAPCEPCPSQVGVATEMTVALRSLKQATAAASSPRDPQRLSRWLPPCLLLRASAVSERPEASRDAAGGCVDASDAPPRPRGVREAQRDMPPGTTFISIKDSSSGREVSACALPRPEAVWMCGFLCAGTQPSCSLPAAPDALAAEQLAGRTCSAEGLLGTAGGSGVPERSEVRLPDAVPLIILPSSRLPSFPAQVVSRGVRALDAERGEGVQLELSAGAPRRQAGPHTSSHLRAIDVSI